MARLQCITIKTVNLASLFRYVLTIPSLYDITLPLLQFMNDQKQHSRIDIIHHLTNHFNLTDEDKNKVTPSGGQKVFPNRVDWARFELKMGRLIKVNPDKLHEITPEGIEVLKQNPEKINRKYLLELPKYREYFYKEKDEEKEVSGVVSLDENVSPEDIIIAGYVEYKRNLESEILDRIKNNPPDFFEKLVVDLVEKMGYGRGTVTGKSGDGGMDGMIDEDKLGLGQIYLQAKRWQGTVPGKEIRDFAGMLDSKKSKKGIFITTSGFSQEAKEFVKNTTSTIRLINGKRLAELMFEFNVGFSPGEKYQLKTIDEDYFS